MPRQIADRKKPTAVKGRLQTIEPHSPFQVLVNTKRLAKGMSWRALAESMEPPVPHQVLFFWCHNLNGFPSPHKFKPAQLKALAKSLGVKEGDLRQALNDSRAIYEGASSTPGPVLDAFAAFIETIEHDVRAKLPRLTVLNRAKAFYNGAAPRPVDK